jgi:hypothetical protein
MRPKRHDAGPRRWKALGSVAVSEQATDPFVLTVGDIGVTQSQIVTPNGVAPLAGSSWLATDMSVTQSKIPTWALVVAIVGAIFTCLLSLLFLLAKEHVTTGYVQVSVRSGDITHTTQVPVTSLDAVTNVRASVAHAQALAAQASS